MNKKTKQSNINNKKYKKNVKSNTLALSGKQKKILVDLINSGNVDEVYSLLAMQKEKQEEHKLSMMVNITSSISPGDEFYITLSNGKRITGYYTFDPKQERILSTSEYNKYEDIQEQKGQAAADEYYDELFYKRGGWDGIHEAVDKFISDIAKKNNISENNIHRVCNNGD